MRCSNGIKISALIHPIRRPTRSGIALEVWRPGVITLSMTCSNSCIALLESESVVAI